jgi:hypothetical protein
MLIITLTEQKREGEDEISKVDGENCRKIFSLIEQAEGTP